MSGISAIGKVIMQNSGTLKNLMPKNSEAAASLFQQISTATSVKMPLLPQELFKISKKGAQKIDTLKKLFIGKLEGKNPLQPITLRELTEMFPAASEKVLNLLRRIHVADGKGGIRRLTIDEIGEIVGKKGLISKLEEVFKYTSETMKKWKTVRFPGDKKGKIPRYIYHLTPAETYEAMRTYKQGYKAL